MKNDEGIRIDPPDFNPATHVWWVQNGTNDMIRITQTARGKGGHLVLAGGNAFYTGLGKMTGIWVHWDGTKPQMARIFQKVINIKEAQRIDKRLKYLTDEREQ